VIYGNLTAPRPTGSVPDWDGADNEAGISSPEHIYNTVDKIYFLDGRSCARVVNRTTNEVKTVLGGFTKLESSAIPFI